ncbi:MAG: ABC transporter ATP-binding protein [Candidatus Gastranaerophilales bacterium]|nr:ABC transporter ATP-binding protein [Candidatus Gastranaerophilales bacterium]
MSILKIENLKVQFDLDSGSYGALKDVSLEIDENQFFAIVGESGSGKTLTVMSILGLLPNTARVTGGKILYKENDLLTFSASQMQKIRGKEIALIPQDPMTSLNPLYTIGNQLSEVINLHKNLYGADAEKYAVEALEAVKIPDAKERLKAYPHELSGGMRQRVAIAAALACDAKIIIADEPTTALDVTVQAQIMSLLNEIKNEFKTSIIFISHDLALVSENADATAVMYNGRIVELCSDKNIFFEPKHPYTEALIRSLPQQDKEKLMTISGNPPTIKDKFSGCAFAPRCIKVTEKCRLAMPEFKRISADTSAACFLYN